MKVLGPFVSECSPEVNAKILDAIEEIVCEYRSFLPDGWRVIIEMIRNDDKESLYYHLDLQSNKGGGDNALIRASSDGDGLIVPYDIVLTMSSGRNRS